MLATLKRIVRRAFGLTVSNTAYPSQWLIDWVKGTSSDSGIPIDGVSAVQYAPIWNAVNKIAGHVGQMPLLLMREVSDRERAKAKEHPSYRLMKRRPNSLMTPMIFKELLQHHALLWGNGRAYIVRNGRGDPDSLLPLPPETQSVLIYDRGAMMPSIGEKWHYYRDKLTKQLVILPDADVFHLPGLGYDGIQGYSLVEIAKNSIGLGLAAEKHMNRHFKNNAVPSLILEAPPGVFRKQEDAEAFLTQFEQRHQGLNEAQKVGLLREGIKANVLAMPGRDAQWIEQRKFQRQEAALWLLLESILGDDASVSYNSLEAKNLAYLTNCLMRWLIKWEEEGNRKLLTEQEQRTDSHYFKFKTQALLRGTTKERYEVYQIGRQIQVLSANDIREMEDLPLIPDGDEYNNPATTPGVAPEEDTSEDSGMQEDADANARRQIGAMLTIESERLVAAAREPGNYIKFVELFYERIGPQLDVCYLGLGGSMEDATRHVEQSKADILEAAGSATQETLADKVIAAVSKWPIRAEEWINGRDLSL